MLFYPIKRYHIPEVGGSTLLPSTSNYQGLQAMACSPFLFGVKIATWFLEGFVENAWFDGIGGEANLHYYILKG